MMPRTGSGSCQLLVRDDSHHGHSCQAHLLEVGTRFLARHLNQRARLKTEVCMGPAWAAGLNKVSESRTWRRGSGLPAGGFQEPEPDTVTRFPFPLLLTPILSLPVLVHTSVCLLFLLYTYIYLFLSIIIIVYLLCECGHTCAIL